MCCILIAALGSIALDSNTDVGEDDWVLEYAMALAQPQPVQFLLVGNAQIGKLRASFVIHVILIRVVLYR